MAYTKFPRGSEWRIWDLHIHTPETKKEDRFRGSTAEEKWTNYINDINAATEEICALGITDYLSVDNYFKFKRFVEGGKITKQFELLLPNVELRVLPVTKGATPINLHCIFNSSLDQQLEARFFAKLKFTYNESEFSGVPSELQRLGRALPGNSGLDDKAALRAGIEQYVIEVGTLRTIFKNDKELRENTIIVVSNKSTDGISGITQHADFFTESGSGSQLDGTRWSIYQFAQAIFSANDKDVLYFTGHGPDEKNIVVQKCAALMPCFHGCDAHENSKIFKPNGSKYCWIKADPTFEGLKQTLYEPENRVKIQAYRPDIKNDRFIISEVRFNDAGKLFGNQSILLNENLNSIIGGKSSGKSLLLYSIASSIDPEQVERLSKRLGFEGYEFGEQFDFEVEWKNGEIDTLLDKENKNRKITYIPQLYINHLVEKNNKEDLNKLIESILLQDVSFKEFYEDRFSNINKITEEIDTLLATYIQVRNKAISIQQETSQLGKSESIKKGIGTLEANISSGQKASTLSENEFKSYQELSELKSTAILGRAQIANKSAILTRIKEEVEQSSKELLGSSDEGDGIILRGKIARILDELTEIPDDIAAIVQNLVKDFKMLQENLNTKTEEIGLSTQHETMQKEIDALDLKLKPLVEKISSQKELQKLTDQLAAEREKLQKALNLEKQFTAQMTDYKNIRAKTASLLKQRFAHYQDIVKKINSTRKDIGTGITLDCKVFFPQTSLPLFDQANKAAIAENNHFHELFKDGLVVYDKLIDLYEQQIRLQDGKLLNADNSIVIPLRNKVTFEEMLRGLIIDSFIIDYSVTYKGDNLLKMSPGKKGTVLLILFLQISSAEYPILIDQPEDNLDNRTIYDLLCHMIKLKKKHRQIIIVSHNANLVIATDSENIIVANQEGQDVSSAEVSIRFGYVNGSLEHSFAKNEKIKQVLYQQGIREHSCDVLEGGDEAFKQRELKYSIK